MRQKYGVFTLFLFFGLLFPACGAVPSPGTQVSPPPSILTPIPTPTVDPHQVTILQNSRFMPAPSPLPVQHGLYLPEITVTGPCDAFGPPPKFLPTLVHTFSIPSGQVLVEEFAILDEIQTANGVGIPLKEFVTIVGPNSLGVSDQSRESTYTLVPTAQVGQTIAFLVTSDFTPNCTPTDPSLLYSCSLVELGKHYPYPMRFSVTDPGCAKNP